MSKNITFINIVWDKDADDENELPSSYESIFSKDFDVEYEGADFLSDIFGYCVISFDFISR